MTLAKTKTRRTEGVQTGGRAARVVETVLRATAEELGRVGYAAFRIEEVAARSGVNKTTIYRRWQGKDELVAAAARALLSRPTVPDTGTLRGDLLAALREQVELGTSPLARGLVRIVQAERTEPGLDRIVRGLREERRGVRLGLVKRGLERGELPAGTDPELVVDLIFSPVYTRIFTHGGTVDEDYLERVVDTVLAGVRTIG